MSAWRKPAWLVGALVAIAALAAWWTEQPSNAPRGVLAALGPAAARFDTRANYATYWQSEDVVRPVFRTGKREAREYVCDLAEQTALAGEGWRENGQLTLNTQPRPRGAAYLRLRLDPQGASFYSLGTDSGYTAAPFKVGGIEQPIGSGTDKFICLYHAANGQPNQAGVMPLWYCGLGFNPQTAELRLTETDGMPDLSRGIVPVRVTSGQCRPLGEGQVRMPPARQPTSAPSAPAAEPTLPPPPPPPPSPPVEPLETRPAYSAGSSICTTSADGRQVWCGPEATICSSSLDGRRVACGGRASICTSSLHGNDVACGGEASICTSSLDGRRVACGGRASICTSSLHGNDVACGGEASICTSSLNGKDVACGGRASICTSSLNGNDVACGGEASICTTSLDGYDAACGGRADTCTSSLRGARACGKGTYTAD
ncbi:hypothetical protein [Novosphingobium sp.]|uniref:hypothetical protein n=1 Tax=Novosphingobium sp. TaxID=1874826 RepID=UPI0035B43B99